MEQFSVKLDGLSQRISEEERIMKALSRLEGNIWSVRSCLSFQVGCQQNINNNLKKLADTVSECQRTTGSMKKALGDVRREYIKTENTITGKRKVELPTLDDLIDAAQTVGVGLAFSVLNPGMGLGYMINHILSEHGETERENDVGKGDFKLKEFERGHNDVFKKNKSETHKREYERKDGKWVENKDKREDIIVDEDHPYQEKEKSDEEKKKDKKKELLDSITLYEHTISRKGSLLHAGVEEEFENGAYSANADFMKAEASAGFKVTARAIEGEVGVGLTALALDAQGRLGSEYNNVHASGEFVAGKAEAKASAAFGFTEDGFELGASASAEAIAAEVSGKAGVTVGGTEVNVGGSLNFGIGAHAKVGLEDGKLSFDIGASVGVGGSVQLEIDMSKTVDYVIDNAENIKNTVCEAASDVYNVASEAVEKAGEAVSDFADGVGDAISSGWSKAKKLWPF